METTFGDYVKKRRLDLEIGLREFADLIGVEPSNYSKIERGLKRAPTGDKLGIYVSALGLQPNGPEHLYLDSLAHVANGEIPTRVLTDEKLAAKLPLLFAGITSAGFSPEQLDSILETVRQAHTPEPEAGAGIA